jgi:transposase-like protein
MAGKNNIVEQDHRGVTLRLQPMLEFKNLSYTTGTIAGVELLHRIRKDEFALGRLGIHGRSTLQIWNGAFAT